MLSVTSVGVFICLPSAECPSVSDSVEVSSAAPAWLPPVSAPPSAA